MSSDHDFRMTVEDSYFDLCYTFFKLSLLDDCLSSIAEGSNYDIAGCPSSSYVMRLVQELVKELQLFIDSVSSVI